MGGRVQLPGGEGGASQGRAFEEGVGGLTSGEGSQELSQGSKGFGGTAGVSNR